MWNNKIALALVVLFAALLVSPAARACCPDDGKGSPKAAARGLGQTFPMAEDLAQDSPWAVYEFERDGISYVQVNDSLGAVRAAVGRIGTTMWVLPIGGDADRVAVPGESLPSGAAQVIYRSSTLEVIRFSGSNGDAWTIRASTAGQ